LLVINGEIHHGVLVVMSFAVEFIVHGGMLGGDQQFYWNLGFKIETIHETWDWSRKF